MLCDALPEGTVQLGRRLSSIKEDDGGVELRFEDGASERFDLVVGADGLSSCVRDHVEESHADAEGSGTCPRDSNPRAVAEPQPYPSRRLTESDTFESRPGRRDAANLQRDTRAIRRGARRRHAPGGVFGRVPPVVWGGSLRADRLVWDG